MLLCRISLVGILTNNIPFCRDYSGEYRRVLGYSDCKNILEKNKNVPCLVCQRWVNRM